MGHISSTHMVVNQNSPVNAAKISRIEPVSSRFMNSNLSVLYFYSKDTQGKEKPVRAWFYDTESRLLEELDSIRLHYPHIRVG